MARPTIHITPEAKLTAAREKRRRYYANHRELILKRRRELRSPKRDMKESQELLKALSKVLHGSASDEDSESESNNENSESEPDTDINLSDLTQCLFALKVIKDEMLMVTDDPCAFVQGVFTKYVKTLDDSIKGDVSILEKPMAIIEGLLNRIIPIQDQILYFCGITSDEWIMSSGSDAVVLQNLISVKNPCYDKKQTNRVRTEWVTAEQKEYLQGLYNDFLKAQAQGTVSAFWPGVYLTWFEKWPEINSMLPDMSMHAEEQKKLLGEAVDKRRQQIRTWFNYRSQRFATDVRDQLQEALASGSVITKGDRLSTMKKLTREAYEAVNPEVKALCLAKVQEERETKASELLKAKSRARERTNSELATTRTIGSQLPNRALEECTGPIAHFLQAIHEMTGFHWTILGAGPDPRYNGEINAMSYHTGINEYGQNWRQATPDFDDKYIKPYVAFISSLFQHVRKMRAIDYVPITPSSTLGTDTNLVAGESQSSNTGQNLPSNSVLMSSPSHLPPIAHAPISAVENMHQPPADTWYPTQHPDGLISFNNGYDFGTLGDFGMSDFENPSTTGIMNTSVPSSNLPACLDSPSISPISAWKRDMLYTSPPRFRPRLLAENFASLTSLSDIIRRSSPAPFIPPPMFSFPPLPVPPPVPGSSASAPVSSPTPFGNLSSHTVAGNNTVDASANGSGIDTSAGTLLPPPNPYIGQNPKHPRPAESQNERPKKKPLSQMPKDYASLSLEGLSRNYARLKDLVKFPARDPDRDLARLKLGRSWEGGQDGYKGVDL
ncbi:uncharacterized protein HD556DRAFT_1314698 [Suillus plorans]|uniref:Uncharacterized protein n=1 Tax=Suillus plorans TaxID=116603 RepID=A0A9P7A9H7_9AGAM|nr:uncharacterized protein HD556DRAFT_1314698 [Suillus plorans]KAG1784899.1 hypothetical protein HD556DRAFT_1314698 [Suillus plorans]